LSSESYISLHGGREFEPRFPTDHLQSIGASCALLGELLNSKIDWETKGLKDLRHNLAKVEVASSSLVFRSSF
jgi:hypothetical protein